MLSCLFAFYYTLLLVSAHSPRWMLQFKLSLDDDAEKSSYKSSSSLTTTAATPQRCVMINL
jgi:hypothetical protein